jgi:hypothetical protein
MRLNQMRASSPMRATGIPGPEGSIQKIFWTELNQCVQQIAQEIARQVIDSAANLAKSLTFSNRRAVQNERLDSTHKRKRHRRHRHQ